MIGQERNFIPQEQSGQLPDTSVLQSAEIIEMQEGAEMIIDDISGGILNLSPQLSELQQTYTNVEVVQLSDLNNDIARLLEGQLDQDNTIYILPGGGGERLALCLEEYGFYMPNQL